MDLAATVLTLGRVRLEPFEERHRAAKGEAKQDRLANAKDLQRCV